MNKLTGMSRKWWMGELTISFAVAFAFGIAVCATAADTRDYSTYVKLKADTTLGYDVVGAAFRVQPKRTPALAGCSGSQYPSNSQK